MADATTTPSPRPLLPELFALLAAHRSAFRQERPSQRSEALLLGWVCAFGRHTVTQNLLALGLVQDDWTAFYRLFSRPRLAADAVIPRPLLGATLARDPAHGPLSCWWSMPCRSPATARPCPAPPGSKRPLRPPPPGRASIAPSALSNRRLAHAPQPPRLLPGAAAHLGPRLPGEGRPAPPASRRRRSGSCPHPLAMGAPEPDAAGRGAQPVAGAGGWRLQPPRFAVGRRCPRTPPWCPSPAAPAIGRSLRCPRRPVSHGVPGPAEVLPRRRRGRTCGLPSAQAGNAGHTAGAGPDYPSDPTVWPGPPWCAAAPAQPPLYLLVVHGVALGAPAAGRRRREPASFWLVSAVEGREGQWELPRPATQLWRGPGSGGSRGEPSGAEERTGRRRGAVLGDDLSRRSWQWSVAGVDLQPCWCWPAPRPGAWKGTGATARGRVARQRPLVVHPAVAGLPAGTLARAANFTGFGRQPRPTGGKWPTGWPPKPMPPSPAAAPEPGFRPPAAKLADQQRAKPQGRRRRRPPSPSP